MVAVGCLVAALTAVVSLVRWAVWRWLAVLAALPLVLVGWLGDVAAGSVVSLVLAGLGLAVFAWRGPPPLRAAAAAAVLVALAVAAFWLLDDDPWRLGAGPWSALLPGVALALAAAAGLGRAGGSPVRLPCLVWLLVPAALLVVCDRDGLTALAWWPPAGALGLTGLLRGRRGAAVSRSQVDDVDRAALDRFAAELDRPLAPVVVVIAAYNEASGLPAVPGLDARHRRVACPSTSWSSTTGPRTAPPRRRAPRVGPGSSSAEPTAGRARPSGSATGSPASTARRTS